MVNYKVELILIDFGNILEDATFIIASGEYRPTCESVVLTVTLADLGNVRTADTVNDAPIQ